MLEPVGNGIERRDGCLAITGPAEAYQLRVASAAPAVKRGERLHLVLSTCEPRIEQTPSEIDSNPIEIQPR
jgi:hypothetical protein